MYSVVLMMALSGSADMPALGHHRASCCGCTGYVAACYGCEGGRHHARHHGGCYGCYGAPAPVCGCYGAPAPVCASCGAPAPACGCYGAPVYAAPAPVCSSCAAIDPPSAPPVAAAAEQEYAPEFVAPPQAAVPMVSSSASYTSVPLPPPD